MPTLYPSELPPDIESDPHREAERRLYHALARLGDDYRVFHSVAWLHRGADGRPHDGETDFVVAHEQHGVFTLEVKGGRIASDPDRRRWTSTDRDGAVHEIRDPVRQAQDAKYALRDKIAALPAVRGRAPFLGHAVAFPDCAAPGDGDLRPDLPRAITLFAEDLEWIDRKVEAILDYWRGESGGRSATDPCALREVERCLAARLELSTPLAADLQRGEERILRLSREQFGLLDYLARNRRVAIRGGAGTGKTVLAVEKARRLAAEGMRTLLTCFNRPLADHLNRRLGEVEGLTVATFHGFCEAMGRRAVLEVPAYPAGQAPPAHFDAFLPDVCMRALEALPEERFDALVVDEGQDFQDDWWTLLRLAQADPDRGILYVFYDDAQNIYGKPLDLPEALTVLDLPHNLRNPVPIHEFAMRFHEGRLETRGPDGPPVEVIEVADDRAAERELSRALHRLVVEERVAPRHIAILSGRSLSPASKKPSFLAGRERIGAFRLGHAPDPVGAGPEPSGDPGRPGAAGEAPDDPDRIHVDSVWRFKGLERRVIVLTELEAILENPHKSPGEQDELLYTACTRATGKLVVLAGPAMQSRLAQG